MSTRVEGGEPRAPRDAWHRRSGWLASALLMTTGVTCIAAQEAQLPSVAMLEFLGGWQAQDTDDLMASLDLLDDEPQESPATQTPAPAKPVSPDATSLANPDQETTR